MEILTAPANLPFAIALAVVLLLGALEIVSLLVGGGLGLFGHDGHDGALGLGHDGHDGALHAHGTHADAAHGHDAEAGEGLLGQVMSWLHAGQIPATILMILFLFNFGVAGLGLQTALKSLSGFMLPTVIAVVPALLIALPATRLTGGLLKPIMPRDESEAVSSESFIGCDAQITVGTARRGAPAEARLRDRFGRSHYVMVEPQDDEDVFPTGRHVLILKRQGDTYRATDSALNTAYAVLED